MKLIGGMYGEDTGWGDEGHLVVVNDTRVTINDAYSFHPSIGIDGQSNTHIAWMDARDYSFAEVSDYESTIPNLECKVQVIGMEQRKDFPPMP